MYILFDAALRIVFLLLFSDSSLLVYRIQLTLSINLVFCNLLKFIYSSKFCVGETDIS